MDFLTIVVILSVLLSGSNVYFLMQYFKYKARFQVLKSTFPTKMRRVLLTEVDKIFTPNEFGATLDTQVQYIGRGNIEIVGGTSDTEAWILSVLAKNAKKMFEFGTCTGKTSYLWAVNSPVDAHIYTLTLSPEQLAKYEKENTHDTKEMTDIAKAESQFTKFMYTDTPVANKVTQIFNDSKLFDEKPYKAQMDLIFVDGSHAYSYVISDSQKAIDMLAPNGILLWHDYRGNSEAPDVYHALNELNKKLPLMHIAGTSLVAYIKK